MICMTLVYRIQPYQENKDYPSDCLLYFGIVAAFVGFPRLMLDCSSPHALTTLVPFQPIGYFYFSVPISHPTF